MTTQAIQLRVIEIFVVDADLKIWPATVAQSEFEHESGYFLVKINNRRTVVYRGGWKGFVTYAAFATLPEAEHFKEFQDAVNRA